MLVQNIMWGAALVVLCFFRVSLARDLLHNSEGRYPKIIPYDNKNSKRFCTFGCSREYHVEGGSGYSYWGRIDKLYPVITDLSRQAAKEFLKGKKGEMEKPMDSNDPVIKACNPKTQDVLNSIVVRNACGSIGGEGNDDDFIDQILIQFTIDVPCSKNTMAKLEKQGITYPETADGFLIPLKAFTSQLEPRGKSKTNLSFVRVNLDFSPGEEIGLPDTKDGFPDLKGKEEDLGWFCKCPYGKSGKTTRSCTFIKSLEGYKCGDKSTPDSQLAYKNNEILGKCGD